MAGGLNPFALAGPEFLGFYAVLGAFVLAAGLLAGRILWLRLPREAAGAWAPGRHPSESDAYLLAFLRGGAREVAHALLIRLAGLELLQTPTCRPRQTAKTDGARLESIERAALEALTPEPGSDPAGRVADATADTIRSFEQRLGREGLLLTEAQRRPFRILFVTLVILLEGVGAARLIQAIARGRSNILFLILAMAAGFVILSLLLKKPPRLTPAGQAYLDWLRKAHKGLRETIVAGRSSATGELALCAAIFGLAGLGQAGAAGLTASSLRRRRASREGVASSIFSCGAGTTCSGGSCGGGGCGGGGCGGCGGG